MAETCCGKNCDECQHRAALSCPGCKAGPGAGNGSCDLAKCVRSKGHETCDTCGFHGNCGTLRGRDWIPVHRQRMREQEAQTRARLAQQAPILGKWLLILFWLFVPNGIAGIMTNDNVAAFAPGLFLPGTILGAVVSAAYALILLRLAPQEEGYRQAGICGLIACGVSLLVGLVSGGPEEPGWTLFLTVPAAIVSLCGEYHEFFSHKSVLQDVDLELADKWEKLWKWYLGSMGLMLGSLLLILILPLLGLLATLAGSIGVIIVSILRLVYLHQTATCFRVYSENQT